MALEHVVNWLTPKAGVSEDKMEAILASIRALTHLPGVLTISSWTQCHRSREWRHPWSARYAQRGRRFAALPQSSGSSGSWRAVAQAL